MNFCSLNEFASQNGHSVPDFPFLHPDENRYQCLLFQPVDTVVASSSGFTCPSLEERCTAFLRLAREKVVALVATPEYCVPWNVLEALFVAGVFPPEGSLWVLGMQSIRPNELDALRDKLDVALLYDRPWDAPRTGEFLDPVCFVFLDSDKQPIVVVQFKQAQASVRRDTIECNHMIHGREGYFIENDSTSIRLAVLLCADALTFTPDSNLPDFPVRSYLLLHLQLNPQPRHPELSMYRCRIFDMNTEDTEVLCLNWGTGTEISFSSSQVAINSPHSALYWKAKTHIPADQTLAANHSGSAYYFYWIQRRAHIYVLHDIEHSLLFDTSKPSQVFGPPPTSVRSGLQNPISFVWDGSSWSQRQLDDGVSDLIMQTSQSAQQILFSLDRIELERFVSLCCAEVSGQSWYCPTKLPSFSLQADETYQRVGFCRDPDSRRQAAQKLAKVSHLVTHFPNGLKKSQSHAPLLQDVEIFYSSTRRNINVYREGMAVATAAYVGDDLGGLRAKQAIDSLRSIFGSMCNPLVFVSYLEDGSLLYISTAGDADISCGPTEQASIV